MDTITLLLIASALIVAFLVYASIAGIRLTSKERTGFLGKIIESIAPLRSQIQESLDRFQESQQRQASESRQEVSTQFRTFSDVISTRFDAQDKGQTRQLSSMSEQVDKLTKTTYDRIDKLTEALLKSVGDIKGE